MPKPLNFNLSNILNIGLLLVTEYTLVLLLLLTTRFENSSACWLLSPVITSVKSIHLSLSLSPLLSLWDPLEITVQHNFPASVAQRPVSSALVMEDYQLAPMKWPLEKTSQNISPSLSLSPSLCLYISHYLPLNLINSPLKQSTENDGGSTVLHHQHFTVHVFAMVGC